MNCNICYDIYTNGVISNVDVWVSHTPWAKDSFHWQGYVNPTFLKRFILSLAGCLVYYQESVCFKDVFKTTEYSKIIESWDDIRSKPLLQYKAHRRMHNATDIKLNLL